MSIWINNNRPLSKASCSNQQGFTLLEVMVAVAITAFIGVAAVQLLSSISDAKRQTEQTSEQLAAFQRFNQILGRDLGQYLDRPIKDEFGETLPSLIVGDGESLIEFSRAGWRNLPTAADPRATLQRVAYRAESIDSEQCVPARENLELQGVDLEQPLLDCLVRVYWPVLDRAPDTEPRFQVVLDQIGQPEIELYIQPAPSDFNPNPELQALSDWPPITPISDANIAAIRLTFQNPIYGEITRIWQLAGGQSFDIEQTE